MKLITLHIGPRNCGKSEFVEKKLSQARDKLYIGTLPRIPHYYSCIEKHRKRRGRNWCTIEISENVNFDLKWIESYLLSSNSNTKVMLDGISTWYFILNEFYFRKIEISYFVNKLVELILATQNDWFLVDIIPEIFQGTDDTKYNSSKYIQDSLISMLNINSIINWLYE